MKNRSTSADSPEQLVDKLRQVIAEAERIISNGAEHAEGDLADLRTRLEDARDRAEALYAEAREKVREGAQKADDTIRSHPYESLAAALAVGVLLGALIRRS